MALTNNLISLWHMNNNWQDSWGTNHATPVGALFSSSSKLGSHAGIFDGIDDRATVAAHSSLNITGDISMMAWVNSSDMTKPSQGVYGKWAGTTQGGYAYLLYLPSGKPVFDLMFGSTEYIVASATALSSNNFHLIIGTRVGTSMKLFVNGVLDAVLTCPAGAFNNISSQGLELGRAAVANSLCLEGKGDEFALWSKALSDGGVSIGQTAGGEVAELWNGGAGIEIGVAVGQPINLRGLNIPGMRQYQPNMLRR